MEILNTFGFNPVLFLAQIVNFLIILWILRKMLYKPVLSMLHERKKTIEEGLKHAEEARILIEETSKKQEKILHDAQSEAKKLIEDARAQRVLLLEQAANDAKTQVDSMLKEARTQISFEAKETEKRLTAHVTKLSIQFLQTTVGNLFGEKEKDLIMSKALKKIKEQAD